MSLLKASMQAAFDKSTSAVIAQGCRSFGNDGISDCCLYRQKEEDKVVARCAIGHLLSDDQITKYGIFENMNPSGFPDALLQELVPSENGTNDCADITNFLLRLQRCHDRGTTPSNFVADFTRGANHVASLYELNPISATAPINVVPQSNNGT